MYLALEYTSTLLFLGTHFKVFFLLLFEFKFGFHIPFFNATL